MRRLLITLFSLILLSPAHLFADSAQSLEVLSEQLVSAKLKQTTAIVTQLEAVGGEKALPLLEAMLAGELFYRKADRRLVIGQKMLTVSMLYWMH